jgi:type III secretion protein N (ATPase)
MMLTVGQGQRVGLFAGPGCGKTTLMAAIGRGSPADAIVVGLIGERGREVREFTEHEFDAELMSRTVMVCATSDRTSIERVRAAFTATAIAEGLRDQGLNVLLMIDSLTRLARAQREIGLSAGEAPARAGFPPSVYALLPRLIERAGNAAGGSITAFYTVLTEGDDPQDPIADAARAILDGHIVLARDLAEQGHYPAIDVETSISRAMHNLVTPEQMQRVRRFRQLYSRYRRDRDLISVGAYVGGSDPLLDQAIALYPRMEAFLTQDMNARVGYADAWRELDALLAQPMHARMAA